MQRIVPHLWFDAQAKEAVSLYTSLFPDSHTTNVSVIEGTPSGSVDIISFTLAGQSFMAMNAGPLFTFNPSVSFLIACASKEEVAVLFEKLSEGGSVLMPLQSYPFSECYGWVADRFGLSWQIMYMGEMGVSQKITPTLMFVGDVCGRAEEAISHYTSVFGDAKVDHMMRYEAGEGQDKAGSVKHAGFTLLRHEFAAMDSAHEHKFAFNEAVSFMVYCSAQEEIDYYSDNLSAAPEAEQCGWIKDKFGVSWQIVPSAMDALMASGDREKVARVGAAVLTMKRLNIAQLEAAARGE